MKPTHNGCYWLPFELQKQQQNFFFFVHQKPNKKKDKSTPCLPYIPHIRFPPFPSFLISHIFLANHTFTPHFSIFPPFLQRANNKRTKLSSYWGSDWSQCITLFFISPPSHLNISPHLYIATIYIIYLFKKKYFFPPVFCVRFSSLVLPFCGAMMG